jgi:hypothetical protein
VAVLAGAAAGGRPGQLSLHIDLFSDDLDGEAARLRALGATEVQRHPGEGRGHIVLADPDGNQFCIVAA